MSKPSVWLPQLEKKQIFAKKQKLRQQLESDGRKEQGETTRQKK
jgi:hypothetical protein